MEQETQVNADKPSWYDIKDRYIQQIPQISEEEMVSRLNKLVPVWVDKETNLVWLIEPRPRDSAYLWIHNPIKCIGRVSFNCKNIAVFKTLEAEQMHQGEISFITNHLEFVTFHTWGYHGFFKPTLEEVAAQLNPLLFEDFDEIFVTTDMFVEGENWPCCIFGPYHVGRTHVFLPKNGRRLEESEYPSYWKDLKFKNPKKPETEGSKEAN